MHKARLLVFLVIAQLTSCASVYQLSMEAHRDAVDETVNSPTLHDKDYMRVMVLPPSGTKRGEFDPQVAKFEREFLRNGLTVISGAVTGRVVFEGAEDESKRVEGASPLSDAERALIMAGETGADAILQIGRFDWSTATGGGRFFVIDPETDKSWREVAHDEFQAWTKVKLHFPADRLTFVGRLTDVGNGEVIASFEITSEFNWNLPARYQSTYTLEGPNPILLAQNFEYSSGQWVDQAREATIADVIRRVAKRIGGDAVGARGSKQSPPATDPAADPAADPASEPAAGSPRE